jgi:hypothetical protein
MAARPKAQSPLPGQRRNDTARPMTSLRRHTRCRRRLRARPAPGQCQHSPGSYTPILRRSASPVPSSLGRSARDEATAGRVHYSRAGRILHPDGRTVVGHWCNRGRRPRRVRPFSRVNGTPCRCRGAPWRRPAPVTRRCVPALPRTCALAEKERRLGQAQRLHGSWWFSAFALSSGELNWCLHSTIARLKCLLKRPDSSGTILPCRCRNAFVECDIFCCVM